jgi:hypothetical protein
MIGDVPGIEGFKVKSVPALFFGAEISRVKFVIKQAALAADEVRMEIIGLEAID